MLAPRRLLEKIGALVGRRQDPHSPSSTSTSSALANSDSSSSSSSSVEETRAFEVSAFRRHERAKGVLEQISRGAPPCTSSVLWNILHSGCFLSEFTFFMRFYVNDRLPIEGELFAGTDPAIEFFAADTPEESWKCLMESKLAEITGCGHFASVMRDNLFFANRQDAQKAVRDGARYSTPQAVLDLIAERPSVNVLIRVEWSTYNADRYEAAMQAKKPKPNAKDFHAYLIDIPSALASYAAALKDSEGDVDEDPRRAFILQSLWGHYDASVKPISREGLRRHLNFLKLFDGESRMSANKRWKFAGRSFWDVPMSAVRKTRVVNSSGGEDRNYLSYSLDKAEFPGEDPKEQVINTLDIFEVMIYDDEAAMERIAEHLAAGFGEEALAKEVPYGHDVATWNDVLNIVFAMNTATEEYARKGEGRIRPVKEFL